MTKKEGKKNYNGKESTDRVKEITEKLEQGIQDLFDSDKYRLYLNTMSKLHHYSYSNSLLIMLQKPDATMVAGYTKWRDTFKRYVKAGEKAIKIIAPAPYKRKMLVEKIDPVTRKVVVGNDGQPVMIEKEISVPSYRIVSVYDVSQTDGQEIPSIISELEERVEQYDDFMDALVSVSPVPIDFEDIEGKAHGYYHLEEKRIAIDQGMSESQTIKTCIHEIAHAKMHAITDTQEKRIDRSTQEVQAESVAYTVYQHFGVDTSEYTFGYVAGWSSGRQLAELKTSLAVIQKNADELITGIESHLDGKMIQRKAAKAI